MFRNYFLPQRSQRFSAEFTEIRIVLYNVSPQSFVFFVAIFYSLIIFFRRDHKGFPQSLRRLELCLHNLSPQSFVNFVFLLNLKCLKNLVFSMVIFFLPNYFLTQRSQRFSAEFTEIGIMLNNSKSAKLCELCVFTEFTMFKKLSVLCGNFSSIFRSFEIGISLQCKKKAFSENEKTFVGVAGFEPAASCSQSRRDNRATLHPVSGCKYITIFCLSKTILEIRKKIFPQ